MDWGSCTFNHRGHEKLGCTFRNVLIIIQFKLYPRCKWRQTLDPNNSDIWSDLFGGGEFIHCILRHCDPKHESCKASGLLLSKTKA